MLGVAAGFGGEPSADGPAWLLVDALTGLPMIWMPARLLFKLPRLVNSFVKLASIGWFAAGGGWFTIFSLNSLLIKLLTAELPLASGAGSAMSFVVSMSVGEFVVDWSSLADVGRLVVVCGSNCGSEFIFGF